MRNIVAFTFMIVFIYFYSYILGGENTIMMLYMLIISPIVSLVLTVPVIRRLDISVETPSAEVEKDGTVKVNVRIKNNTFLPVPFVDIIFIQAPNFEINGQSAVKVSLGSYRTKTISMEYTAKCRGVSEIGIKNIILSDYLGFFRFSILKHLEDCRTTGEITVLPRLFNLKSNSKIMLSSGQSDMSDDAGAESSGFYNWTGEPGYEFREYMPGDPLHKVHWKLSAKKDAFMVRKDEGRGISKKYLVIDPFVKFSQGDNGKPEPSDTANQSMANRYGLIVEEKVLESILSVANAAIKSGREVEVCFFDNGRWIGHSVKETKSIKELQYRFAAYKFERTLSFDSSNRMPLPYILEKKGQGRYMGGGEVVVFTASRDKELLHSIDEFLNYRMTVDLVLVKNPSKNMKPVYDPDKELHMPDTGRMWVLAADEDLTEAFS